MIGQSVTLLGHEGVHDAFWHCARGIITVSDDIGVNSERPEEENRGESNGDSLLGGVTLRALVTRVGAHNFLTKGTRDESFNIQRLIFVANDIKGYMESSRILRFDVEMMAAIDASKIHHRVDFHETSDHRKSIESREEMMIQDILRGPLGLISAQGKANISMENIEMLLESEHLVVGRDIRSVGRQLSYDLDII